MNPRALRLDASLALALVVAGILALAGGSSANLKLFLNFGPNDQDYVSNFRIDWEPEGRTRFHWTLPRAQVTLPLLLSGDGHRLRLRARRHFLEPAHVTLRAEGRAFARFDIQADPQVAWRVVEFPLPALEGRAPFTLDIDAPSSNPRPLGIALDWMEIERAGPGARSAFQPPVFARLAVVLTGVFLALRIAGLAPGAAFGFGLVLAAGAGLGAWRDLLAVERILREGAGALVVTGGLATLLVRWPRTAAALGLTQDERRWAGVLAAIVTAALALRLVLLLHPQFYYPDVRIHAVFARELAKTGLAAFLRDFTANQYRFSLGLQFENGHWYAFPYPPAFYALCWPLLRALRYSPEVAVALLAAVVNSLEALLVFALGRRLSARPALAIVAAAAVPLLPIFVTRLSLAYFPALVGHAVDAAVMSFLVARMRRLNEPRTALTLAALLALALLTYTQSLLNWGLLLPGFLLLWVATERTPESRRRQLGLLAAGALGALLSLGFYGRYIPVFLDMQRGVPMPEERVLLDKAERARVVPGGAPLAAEEPDDPFSGPGVDLGRGTRKAISRLFVFYGWFAPVIVVGLMLLWRRAPGVDERRLIACWALLYLVLNLASGGLPGPNLVRYNKDLEVVAPLFCLALAQVTLALWDRARPLGWTFVVAFSGFGALRLARALTEKFFALR